MADLQASNRMDPSVQEGFAIAPVGSYAEEAFSQGDNNLPRLHSPLGLGWAPLYARTTRVRIARAWMILNEGAPLLEWAAAWWAVLIREEISLSMSGALWQDVKLQRSMIFKTLACRSQYKRVFKIFRFYYLYLSFKSLIDRYQILNNNFRFLKFYFRF